MNASVLPERFNERSYTGTGKRGIPGYHGEHYSKASISRILDYLREDVSQWLTRSLKAYYPIIFIDCVHMKIHCKRSIETEAFYVVLAVREDKRYARGGDLQQATESALSWGKMLAALQEQGVRKIDLMCADGLKGLEDVISAVFPGTPLQRCTMHLKRNLLGGVRNGDKGELAEDLRQVFRTRDRSYSVERAWEQWQALREKWGGVRLSQFSTTG